MIYGILADGTRLVILEPGNFDRLRQGKPIHTPDGAVLICFTPDIKWTATELEKSIDATDGINPDTLVEVLEAGLKRPEIHAPEYHMRQVLGTKPS